jgi:hypothetical protein
VRARQTRPEHLRYRRIGSRPGGTQDRNSTSGLKFGDGNTKKRLAGFTGLMRGEIKKPKKILNQKTLAAWCTQHKNQAHKSRIWLQEEKHHHRKRLRNTEKNFWCLLDGKLQRTDWKQHNNIQKTIFFIATE